MKVKSLYVGLFALLFTLAVPFCYAASNVSAVGGLTVSSATPVVFTTATSKIAFVSRVNSTTQTMTTAEVAAYRTAAGTGTMDLTPEQRPKYSLGFRVRRTSGTPLTEALTVNSTGFVGIGNVNPANNLDVNGGIGASSVTLSGVTEDPTSPAGSLAYRSDLGVVRVKNVGGWGSVSSGTVNGTALDTGSSTQTKSGGLIVNGFVGISTTPVAPLDMGVGAIRIGQQPMSFFQTSTPAYTGLMLYNTTDNDLYFSTSTAGVNSWRNQRSSAPPTGF